MNEETPTAPCEEAPITVRWYGKLSGTPGELLALEGMSETARAGHLLGIHVSPGNECIVSFHEGTPVALVVLDEYPELGELWIHFGYCREEFRRKGYYRRCIELAKYKAKELGYSRIHTAVAPTNTAAIASIQGRGGSLQYLGYTFPVE